MRPSTRLRSRWWKRVLARNRAHIGANHYHIHLLEAEDPGRALPSARRLDDMRPEAGHLLHMPSHIYLRLGDYHAAVLSNQRAFAADRAAEKAIGQFPAMGYHTREFLRRSRGHDGTRRGRKAADDNLFVQLRFNRWDDVLEAVAAEGRRHPTGMARRAGPGAGRRWQDRERGRRPCRLCRLRAEAAERDAVVGRSSREVPADGAPRDGRAHRMGKRQSGTTPSALDPGRRGTGRPDPARVA